MTSMKRMLSQGLPTAGDVNQSAPFGFSSSSSVGADYRGKPSVNALANPTLHNSVPEAMVNSTASVPLFVRPFQMGFEKGYSEGDILFVERNLTMRDTTHNNVFNLPVLNHCLRTVMEKGNGINIEQRKYDSLEKVLEQFNYFGILNTDMDTGSKWQRLLNINVRGRTRVARLWKPAKGHLTKGTCVYLGLFKQKHKVKRMQGPNGLREIVGSTDQRGTYYQFRAVLPSNDIFKTAEYLIPIGIVSQVTLKTPSDQAIENGHYVTESCKSLERIELLMRI